MESGSEDADLAIVLDLTKELPEHDIELARLLDRPRSFLWELHLASRGRMLYPDQQTPGLPFPDAEVAKLGTTRYAFWRTALEKVLDLLGPDEALYRTGHREDQLRSAIENYFGLHRSQ